MPSITHAQYQKFSSQAPDGWSFDLEYYVIWGEKTLIASQAIDDDHRVVGKLEYVQNYIPDPRGLGGKRPANHYHIALHISVYTRSTTGGCWVSSGMGAWLNLDQGEHPRKNYAALCKIAATIKKDDLLPLYSIHH